MFLQSQKADCEMAYVVCTVMLSQEREIVMPLMMKGFRDAAEEGGTSVTGGQTVINPWIIVGGVASVVCQPNDFIMWVFLTGFSWIKGLSEHLFWNGLVFPKQTFTTISKGNIHCLTHICLCVYMQAWKCCTWRCVGSH